MDSGHILRGQFVARQKAGPVRRPLQERIRVQPAISFHDIAADMVAGEQDDADAAIAITKKYDPLHMPEYALAPSPLSAIQSTLQELALDMAFLKQKLSALQWDSILSPMGENLLQWDPE